MKTFIIYQIDKFLFSCLFFFFHWVVLAQEVEPSFIFLQQSQSIQNIGQLSPVVVVDESDICVERGELFLLHTNHC